MKIFFQQNQQTSHMSNKSSNKNTQSQNDVTTYPRSLPSQKGAVVINVLSL